MKSLPSEPKRLNAIALFTVALTTSPLWMGASECAEPIQDKAPPASPAMGEDSKEQGDDVLSSDGKFCYLGSTKYEEGASVLCPDGCNTCGCSRDAAGVLGWAMTDASCEGHSQENPGVCDLDDPASCPDGKKCVVPDGLPTRTGKCEAVSNDEPVSVCDLDDPTSCPKGSECVVPEGLPTRTGSCAPVGDDDKPEEPEGQCKAPEGYYAPGCWDPENQERGHTRLIAADCYAPCSEGQGCGDGFACKQVWAIELCGKDTCGGIDVCGGLVELCLPHDDTGVVCTPPYDCKT
jgi:hypothetical protein